MKKVLIYGAGSIGNHLARACRGQDWDVVMCDMDAAALDRTRTSIYPSRYGAWDEKIQLVTPDKLAKSPLDIVIIGTPPDSHLKIALDVLKSTPPKVMLIEKPLCSPDLKGCNELLAASKSTGCNVLVGYNHALCKNTIEAHKILEAGTLGSVLSLNVRWLEYWGGIFSAHPWLNGPKDSYLGFAERGGGACGEHSHGIHIWQHFAHACGRGRISEVSCMMDMVSEGGLKYDSICQISVKTEKGLVGSIMQDVITEPPVKTIRVQGDRGWMEWYANYDKGQDAVIHGDGKVQPVKTLVAKTRPDDFKGEVEHMSALLAGTVVESSISLVRGLETALIIAAAHESHRLKKTVRINYGAGYGAEAIVSA